MAEPNLTTTTPVPQAAEPLLTVRALSAGYGGRPVIHDVDLEVMPGEIVALFGSNGAGKTTTLSCIVGAVTRTNGDVSYQGRAWPAGRPWKAAANGMAMIPAERFTFANLTVEENLRLGAYSVSEDSFRESMASVVTMFPILQNRLSQKAGTMSGGEQRMLSVALALMSRPRLLLLDEPSLGLAPRVVDQLIASLRTLVDDAGLSVLMVEQNVAQAVKIADRIYVLRSGRIIEQLSGDEARAREQWWDLF
jgi:branched-chain amino acid transport system ATP-binding protein